MLGPDWVKGRSGRTNSSLDMLAPHSSFRGSIPPAHKDPNMIDPPNPTQNAHCRIALHAPDGAARRYEMLAWACDAAKPPGKDYRLDGQPVVFSGLADGSLFASDTFCATRSPRWSGLSNFKND